MVNVTAINEEHIQPGLMQKVAILAKVISHVGCHSLSHSAIGLSRNRNTPSKSQLKDRHLMAAESI